MAGIGALTRGSGAVTNRPLSRLKVPFARQPFWGLLFVLLLVTALTSLAMYLFSPDWLRINQELPVGLRSPLKANYGVDPLKFSLSPLQKHILEDAIRDQPQAALAQTPVDQLATLVQNLLTPVPTVTPRVPGIPFPTFTQAVLQKTVLPSATVTLAASSTIMPTATTTSQPTASLTATATTRPAALPTALPTTSVQRSTATPAVFHPSPTSGRINTQAPTAVPTQPPAPKPTNPPPQPTQPPAPPSYPAPPQPTSSYP